MIHSGGCIRQDLVAFTTTTIAPVKSEKKPSTYDSATLAGVIATENAFRFFGTVQPQREYASSKLRCNSGQTGRSDCFGFWNNS